MLDAGLEAEFLKTQLATLAIKDLDIKLTETERAGLRALRFVPITPKQQQHRNLTQITEIIEQSKITERAKKTATTVFTRLAQAEATVHNKNPQDIHFHEVGALDSIIDIVSASVCLDALDVQKVYCSTLSLGGGTVKCTHGLLPVPAPATVELLKGVPVVGGPIQAELLTPTAAAILTTIADRFGPLPSMKVEAVGYGAGSLESEDVPNVLRLILGQAVTEGSENTDSVWLLEANIDDATGELVGWATKKLFEHGALDVFTTPIYMKQSRPAVQISILCKLDDVQQLEQVLFEQGLTFGIRKQILQRSKLVREFVTVETEFGRIRIKVGKLAGKIVNAKPEFSDCAAATEKYNLPVKTVLDAAIAVYKTRK